MSGTLGRVKEFNGSSGEDWPRAARALFLLPMVLRARRRNVVLLSVIGASTYKTLRNLVSPAKPGEKSYAELVGALSKHYKPAPSEIVERFKFHSRNRRPGESVATFVAEL